MGANQPVPAKPFDFSNCLTSFDNTNLIGATSIKVSFDSDATTDDVGADGSVVVVVSNDQRGTVEIEFMQNSPSIEIMSQQVTLFLATKEFKAASFEDLNSGSTASCPQCWVAKVPDSEYGKESSSRTFRIRFANMTYQLKGLQ